VSLFKYLQINLQPSFVFGEAYAGIRPSEPEAIGQRNLHLRILRRVRYVIAVKVLRGIPRRLEIKGWW